MVYHNHYICELESLEGPIEDIYKVKIEKEQVLSYRQALG